MLLNSPFGLSKGINLLEESPRKNIGEVDRIEIENMEI